MKTSKPIGNFSLKSQNSFTMKTHFKNAFLLLFFFAFCSGVAFGQFEQGTYESLNDGFKKDDNTSYTESAGGLTNIYTGTGNYFLSSDGGGSTAASYSIEIEKPTATSTVVAAYVLSSTIPFGTDPYSNGCITLNGNGINLSGTTTINGFFTIYADITSLAQTLFNPAPAGISTHTIGECISSSISGTALLVVFEDPSLSNKTISINWGAQDPVGDNFAVNFAPIDPSDPASVFDMGLGIGYSFQGTSQISEVSVNGTRLSSSAGGQDDGAGSNGALITVGGIGDSNANPPDPFANPGNDTRYDDELYSILPFITNATTSLSVSTVNPSNDDIIFLAHFSISGEANVVPCDNPIVATFPVLECLDNGTPGDDTDDRISFSLNVTGGNGTSFSFTTTPNVGISGGTLSYGTTHNSFIGDPGSANGSTITLNIVDDTDSDCFASADVSIESCSQGCVVQAECVEYDQDPIDLPACSAVPAGETDHTLIFDVGEDCGQTITMDYADTGDTDPCGGAAWTRTYTLYFDGVAYVETCTQDYIIAAEEPLSIACPTDVDASACDYADQAALDAAYAAWLAGFEVTGAGCGNGVGSFDITPPDNIDLCVGDTITLTYTYEDDCTNATCTQTFAIEAEDEAMVSCPSDVDATTCDYGSQAGLDAAYAAWLADFEVTEAGCGDGIGVFTTTPPVGIDYCMGDTITLTYEYDDGCGGAGFESDYIAATWDDQSVHFLDSDLNSVGSFPAGSTNPNGIATDGSTIWTAHFTTQEIIAYDQTGTQLYSLSGVAGTAQGMEYVNGELVVAESGNLNFYDPVSGNLNQSLNHGQGSGIEGITYDGTLIWMLGDSGIFGINPADGSLVSTIPNAAAYCAFDGTALGNLGGGNLIIGCTNGDWHVVAIIDGSISLSGNNGLDMYGIKGASNVANGGSGTVSCTATFAIAKPAEVAVSCPADVDMSTCDYPDPESLQIAYDAWLAQFEVIEAGCGDGIGKFDPPPASLDFCNGDTVTVVYNYFDNCTSDICIASFMVSGAPPVEVSCPSFVDASVCDYADQAALDAAYQDWLNQFVVVEEGCGDGIPTFNVSIPQSIDYCLGDTIIIDMNYTDGCSTDACKSTFAVAASAPVTISCPDDASSSSCDYADQAELSAAYSAWLAQFEVVDTGCGDGIGGFDVNPPADIDYCVGATVTLTYSYTDGCTTASCTKTFEVIAAPEVAVSCPAQFSAKESCFFADQAALDAAYQDWLSQFSVSEAGCGDGIGMFNYTPPASIDICAGDTIIIMYSYSDYCTTDYCAVTFAVAGSTQVEVSCPEDIDVSVCEYADQAALDAAYAAWLAEFEVVEAGCGNGQGGFDVAPPSFIDYCVGDTITLTFSYTDGCSDDACTATFAVAKGPEPAVSCPGDVDELACDYADQAAIDAAYAAWLAGFQVTEAGCGDGIGSFTTTPPASIDYCLGDTVTLTYEYGDGCGEGNGTFEVLSIADSRVQTGWTMDGSALVDHAVPKLLNPANFGAGGTLDGDINITSTADPITAALLSNYDLLYIGFLFDGTLTASELLEIGNWVNAGGKMIITADDPNFDDVAEYFGHPTTTQGNGTYVPAAGQSSHPIFDGPFGTISSFSGALTLGFFNTTAGATVIAEDLAGNATILEKFVGAGHLMIIGDICTHSINTLTFGGTITSDNDKYLGNLFAHMGAGVGEYVASCTATFAVAAGDIVEVSCPADVDASVCDYDDQNAITVAYQAWLDAFEVLVAGCGDGIGGFTTTPPAYIPYCDGDTIVLTYTYTDGCTTDECTSMFALAKGPEVEVACPNDEIYSSCDFTDQAALDAAYNTWLAGFITIEDGCGGVCGFVDAPPLSIDLCLGDTITLTYRCEDFCSNSPLAHPLPNTDACSIAECTATFVVARAEPVTVVCTDPVDDSVCSYADQAELDAAYQAWLAGFSVTEAGCGDGVGSFDIVPPTSIDYCLGDTITLTYSYTDGCTDAACTSMFAIAKGADVAVACPTDVNQSVCDYTDQAALDAAYAAWLAGFAVTEVGCGDGIASFDVAPPASIDYCDGASITVTYTYTDGCTTDECTASFIVTEGADPAVSCPGDVDELACDYADQAALDAAYAAWLAEFEVTEAGCGDGIGSFTTTPPASIDYCMGDTITLTYEYDDGCVDGPQIDELLMLNWFGTPRIVSVLGNPTDGFSNNGSYLTDGFSDQTYGMDPDPNTGLIYVAASPDGDQTNRHLYTYDEGSGTLTQLGQVFSSGGDTHLQAITFDGAGNLWGSFDDGVLEIIDIATLTGIPNSFAALPENGRVGLTWDFDNGQLLYATGSYDIYGVNTTTGVATLLVSNTAVCIGHAQGMEYVGGGLVYTGSSWGCDIISIDLATGTETILFSPASLGLNTSFKDIIFRSGNSDDVVSCTATFAIERPAEVAVSCPDDLTSSSCDYADQAELDAAYSAWLAGFSVTEAGCGDGLGAFTTVPPAQVELCPGGEVTLTFEYMDGCTMASCTKTFLVTPNTDIPVLDCPADAYLGINPLDVDNDAIPDVIPTSVPYTDGCGETGMTTLYTDQFDMVGCQHSLIRTFMRTDRCGLMAECSVIWTWMIEFEVEAQVVDITCLGFADGSITAIPSPASQGPYTYVWSNGATTQTIDNLDAGTYSVTVSTAEDCEVVLDGIIVNEPELLDAEESALLLDCFGDTNGQIFLTVTGGTPWDPDGIPNSGDEYYLYDWYGDGNTGGGSTFYDQVGDFDDPMNPSGLPAGTYICVIIDANLCNTEVTAVIAEPAELLISGVNPSIDCSGNPPFTGDIDITVTGGFGPKTYQWVDVSNTIISTDEDLTGVPEGTYTVTVTDMNGCTTTQTIDLACLSLCEEVLYVSQADIDAVGNTPTIFAAEVEVVSNATIAPGQTIIFSAGTVINLMTEFDSQMAAEFNTMFIPCSDLDSFGSTTEEIIENYKNSLEGNK